MKNIIFIAPPAAGKGTQSSLLVDKYGFIHISTGDLLRNEVASKTELGNKLEEIMSSGNLVDDEIVTELLKKRLSLKDTNVGYILDGYPRTLAQAHSLDSVLTELVMDIKAVIYLDMDVDTAMKRALGRITCPKCGRGYNKYEEVLKPKTEGICDDCGETLQSRSDDNESTFKNRFETYISNTQPLIDYYEEKGLLNKINNNGTPEETFKLIEEVINRD